MNEYKNRGRRSWRFRGQGGRYNHGVYSENRESDSMHTSESTDLSVAASEESSTNHTATAFNPHSSAPLASAGNARRGTFLRGRGNRRPWKGKTTIRPATVESTSDAAYGTYTNESVVHTGNVGAAGIPTAIHWNARQHHHRGLMHGTRAQPSSGQSWQSRGRYGRNSHVIHSACNEPTSALPIMALSISSPVAVDDGFFGTFNVPTSVNAHASSASLVESTSDAAYGTYTNESVVQTGNVGAATAIHWNARQHHHLSLIHI